MQAADSVGEEIAPVTQDIIYNFVTSGKMIGSVFMSLNRIIPVFYIKIYNLRNETIPNNFFAARLSA